MAIQEHLWEFPHTMQLKVMGNADAPLEQAFIDILTEQLGTFDATSQLSSRPSSKGTFVSYTAKITVQNREQVEAIYQALDDCPYVKMKL